MTEQTALDIIAPNSVEAEEAVLGSILIDPACLEQLGFLETTDFYEQRRQWIFEAMRDLAKNGDPIDVLMVDVKLKDKGAIASTGAMGYLVGLYNKTPNSLHVEGYARIVETTAMRREMLSISSDSARAAHSEGVGVDKSIQTLRQRLDRIAERYESSRSTVISITDIHDLDSDQVEEWQNDPQDIRGAQCGFYPLDMAMGGWEPKRLYALGAPTGAGKSTLLAKMAAGFAEREEPCLFVALEMPAIEVFRMMACQRARVNSIALKRGKLTKDEYARYKQAAQELKSFPLWFEDRGGLSLQAIQATARKLHREKGVTRVFVDTFQKIADVRSTKTSYESTTDVSVRLSVGARDSEQSWIVAYQLSRAGWQRQDKRPILPDFRDSGSVEQDIDGAFMIYRDGYYYPEKPDSLNKAEIIVRKNRYGEANIIIDAFWQPEFPSFERLHKETIELNEPASPKLNGKKGDSLERAKRRVQQQEAKQGEFIDAGDGIVL